MLAILFEAWNVVLSIVGGVIGSIVTVVRFAQKDIARTPMEVTFAGIVISLIAIPLNDVLLIVTRFGGRVTSARLSEP